MDIVSLIASLKTHKHVNNEGAFNNLASLIGPNIRIRYDLKSAGSDGNNTSKYSYLNGANISRVLLTSDRNNVDFNSLLAQQCNGVVLEYPSWKPLCIPPSIFNPRFKLNHVIKLINDDKYFITEINDGTTVTLYWGGAKWLIASSNGFEVNDYKWIGETTYEGAIKEVASKHYPQFDMARLCKTKCYTIGFRHHDFHPLQTDPVKMWFIQSCDLTSPTLDINTTENIGIPIQTQIKIDTANFTLSLNEAFTRYIRSLNSKGQPATNTQGISTPDIHYGYLLRGSYADCGSLSNIILESSLLKRIRQLMYNLPKNKNATISPATSKDRLTYNILRAYLSASSRQQFISLFPQYSPQYEKFKDIFSKLVARILSAIRSKTIRSDIMASKKSANTTKIDILARSFLPHIEMSANINPFDSQSISIIEDFVIDQRHIDIFYACFSTL